MRSRLTPGDRLLMTTLRHAPAWTVAMALAVLLGGAATLVVPLMLKSAVDQILAGAGTAAESWFLLAIVLAADVTLLVATSLLAGQYQTRAAAWLQHRLFGHVVDVGLVARARLVSGDLISTLTADCTAVGRMLPDVLIGITEGLIGLAAVVALGLIDWRLASTLLVGFPIVMVASRKFFVRSTDLTAQYRLAQSRIAGLLLDALAGIQTIRANGTSKREVERVLSPLTELGTAGRALWSAQRSVGWQQMLVVRTVQLAVLAMSGASVAAGRITPGELLATMAYVPLALGLLSQLAPLATAASARASAARIAEVLDIEVATKPAVNRRLPRPLGRIELRSVRVFSGADCLLDGVDFEVPAGTTLAVVGAPGSGKTTLAWLIGRLIDPDEGVVLLDGIPLPELDSADLADAVGYAFERPFLLGESVRDAIAFGLPGISQAEVEHAAGIAQADDFIRRLPAGYDTPMSQAPLSGGEIQRIGLARLVARRAKVLVLDDATAGLDTVTEARIAEALAVVRVGRTSIVVAHLPSSAARSDLVAWLADGRLKALAPHQVLLGDPEYRALFDLAAWPRTELLDIADPVSGAGT